MSQAGTSSSDAASIPTMTAAQVKIAFVPDMESLDAALQEAERHGTATIDRIKAAAKQAIAELETAAIAAIDAAEARKARATAIQTASDAQQDQTQRVPPVADQTLLKLTQIQVSIDRIADTADTIADNTTPKT